MLKLKTVILLILSVIISISSTGCWSLRSAQGLSEGEINVNYIVPIAGSVRYGVIDNLEARFVMAFENRGYDLFYHSNHKDNSLNYGLSIGATTLNDIRYNGYACIVLSKRSTEYVNPYLSVLISYDSEIKAVMLSQGYSSLGAEIRIPVFKSMSLLITPEVSMLHKEANGDIFKGSFFGTGNVGLIVNLY